MKSFKTFYVHQYFWVIIRLLPIVEVVRLMKCFLDGEKIMLMLRLNLGKFETRWTLASWNIVSTCQDISPSGRYRISWTGWRILTLCIWVWTPKGLDGLLVPGRRRVTFFFGSVWQPWSFLTRVLVATGGVTLILMLSWLSSQILVASSFSLSEAEVKVVEK